MLFADEKTKPFVCGACVKGGPGGLKCKVVLTSILGLKIPQSSFAEASRSLTEASGAIFQQKNMRAFRKGRTNKLRRKCEKECSAGDEG